MPRVMAVDGNNLLIRAIKAMERTGLSADGVATGPLLSFINCMSRYTREFRPDRLVVCFDGGRSFYRCAIDPEYKANRLDSHEERHSHFALAKEFLALANIHFVQVPQVEADDLIAAYWRNKPADHQMAILSGDKDFFQLIEHDTLLYRPSDDANPYTPLMVEERMGCLPRHIPSVMALTGDTSDNIPGVPGFGTKTAVKHLAAHDWTLENLFHSKDPKVLAKVNGQKERVATNLMLVDLRMPWAHDQVPVGAMPLFRPTGKGSNLLPGLIHFLDQYEMNSVRNRLFEGTLWHTDPPGQIAPPEPNA